MHMVWSSFGTYSGISLSIPNFLNAFFYFPHLLRIIYVIGCQEAERIICKENTQADIVGRLHFSFYSLLSCFMDYTFVVTLL